MRSTVAAALSALVLLASPLAQAESKTYNVKVDGMHCAPCVQAVKEALSKVEGVDQASLEVVLKKRSATFTVANDNPEMEAKVRQAIEDQGYKVASINGHKVSKKN